jgi:hypothetical protein
MTEDATSALRKALDKARLEETIERRVKGIKNQYKYEWFEYADSFIEITKVLITDLKTKSAENQPNSPLILPILFNLRHAIELSLKCLAKYQNQEVDKSHDPTALFKTSFGSKFQDPVKIKKMADSDIGRKIKITSSEIKMIIKKFEKDLQEIAEKYYYHFPLIDCLGSGDFYIEDPKNELFRYPESEYVKFRFRSSAIRFSEKELEDILKDVSRLGTILRFFWVYLTN